MTLSLPPLLDAPPESDRLTGYDREHFATASARDGDRYDAIKYLVGSDAELDRDRTRKIYDAHLERAKWMTRTGYRLLLSGE